MTREDATSGVIEATKQLGFPIVVALFLMWVGKGWMEGDLARFDKQQEFITQTLVVQLERGTAAITALNETQKEMAAQQRETREVLKALSDRRDAGNGH